MNDTLQKIEPILSWVLGFWSLFMGVIGLGFQINIIDAVLCIIIATLLLPPIRQTVFQYYPKRLPGAVRILIIVLLFTLSPNLQAAFMNAQPTAKLEAGTPKTTSGVN